MTSELDARARAAQDWTRRQLGRDALEFAPASADASFRRYFRAMHDGHTWIVMDAPPARENCRPFIEVTALAQAAGLRVPQILAQDLEQGFLLLSDLGRQTLLQVLTEDNADALLLPALASLVDWQRASRPGVLPPYDRALLQRELDLFPEWYVGRHLGRRLDAPSQALWDTVCEQLMTNALAQPSVFVHRDYMPRNLMLSDGRPSVLDYQDAVYGPISYDVISLFKDAFLSWPQARVDGWLAAYWHQARAAGLPVPDALETFCLQAERMGSQRHLKVLGIFARICHRDGKPHYLADAPRFLAYLRARCVADPWMAPLGELLDRLELTP